MRLSNRSYPHPVVGNADDVADAGFQATIDFESDKTTFYLTVNIACSSRTLIGLIKRGKACYSLHVECSNTLYRNIFDFNTDTARFAISAREIFDNVEVNAFVRAKAALPKYAIDGAHPDYGDTTFDIHPGDILAVGDGQAFDATQDADPLRRVGAMMVVIESHKDGHHAMEVDTQEEKIQIVLCKQDFADYSIMKSTPKLTSHLTTTLTLPVLIHAIHLLDDPDTVEQCKWAVRLQRRVDELSRAGKFGTTADALTKAQYLLDLPIRRALASALEYSQPTGS